MTLTTTARRRGTPARLGQILRIAGGEAWAHRRRRGPAAEHIHRALVRLGPTFIKLGQVASTRPDLVPVEVSNRLRDLQEDVPPFPFSAAREVIEAELGRPLEEAFATFPDQPVASASLSQVYLAQLPDGTPVAVKVQRPDLRQVIDRDLAVLDVLARVVTWVRPSLRALRPQVIVGEFGRWTRQELDFEVEGRNLDEFRANFADWDDVVFPEVHWTHTTSRVLTMQRVEGMRLWDVREKLGRVGAHRLARRLAELEMKMFISDQFFHADLHPGNIFFGTDGRIYVLDVGMVGRMSNQQRDRFLAYWISITRRQRDRAFEHLLAMTPSSDPADHPEFRTCFDELLDRFYDADLSDRSLAQTYLEILLAGAKHGVVFPPELILQAKAVVTAEALDLVLAPDFRFAEEVRPIVARELAKRATPRALIDRLWGGLAEWVVLGEWPATLEPPTDTDPDEDRFRRQTIEALAAEWADAADSRLTQLQTDLPRYLSADHWQQHPEAHALLETTVALGAQLARTIDRSRPNRSDGAPPHVHDDPGPLPSTNGVLPGQERLQAAVRDLTIDVPMIQRWQSHVAASAAVSLGRTLVGRLEQAIVEASRHPRRANRPSSELGARTPSEPRSQGGG